MNIVIFLLVLVSFPYALAAGEDSFFKLGTINIIAPKKHVGKVGDDQVASTVTQEDMAKFNTTNVADALNILSGVAVTTNSRNEKMITVRGLDPRQVPLFIDGIPVYVPYDGYVDLGRFSTADLAQIQVAKGMSSVAYGPNALGGAINLISRKPTRRFEGDAIIGAGSGDEQRASANLGSNQGKWYLQTGASYLQSDSFPMSKDFTSTGTENGGDRNNAYRKDTKLSVKVGVTPEKSDEYALSYYQQEGVKGQPPSTDPAKARYWKWPYWNKKSLYFVSQTALGASEILKTRLYHDKFDNKVNSYTDDSYSTPRTTGPGSVSTGSSIYNDRITGGSLGLESFRSETHSLNLVAMFKEDHHEETDAKGTQNSELKDQIFTIAAEDNIKLSDDLSLLLGISRHQLKPKTVFSLGNPYSLPERQNATDGQAGLFYDIGINKRLYVTIARKIRMPTLKDRYSQRLGKFIENPSLHSEKALNYEIGFKGEMNSTTKIEMAVFMSDINQKIQAVANVSGNKSQMQNVDRVQISGVEFSMNKNLLPSLALGGSYTLTDAKSKNLPDTKIVDVPAHKIMANLQWTIKKFEIVPFYEYNSRRWVSDTHEISGFSNISLKMLYKLSANAAVEAGVTNLADKNYALAEGFPQPGRMTFTNLHYTF